MRRFIVLSVAALVLAACSGSSADESAPATSTLPAYTPELEPRECGYEPPLAVETTCSWLVVPEDRARPDSRSVRLAVAFLHSTAKDPLPDPVVYLHGGPGDSAVAGAPGGWENDSRLAKRDVVLWDQRGAGLSEPSLNCPEIEQAIRESFRAAKPYADELQTRRDAVRVCRDRLSAKGIDLAAYDTTASAADLEDLRRALGIETWNLAGVSYGTRLALEAMRSYPTGIRSVLLDSVAPPDRGSLPEIVAGAERAFAQLAKGCAANEKCAREHGDVEQLLTQAYERLNAQPYRGSVDLGAEHGGVIPLEVNGADIIGGGFTALYERDLIPVLPGAVAALARGDNTIIPLLAQEGIPIATAGSEGAYLSVECADTQDLDREGDAGVIADPGRYAVVVTEAANSMCDVWDVPSQPGFNEPVHSDIPALALAGRYDPVTPPGDTRDAAEELTNATYVEIDGIGHAVIFSNPCGSAIYRSFLAHPADSPATECAEEQPPPAF